MKMLVDTSAIVAALKRGEQRHAEAANLFQKARLARHGLFLTNFILAEAYSLILVDASSFAVMERLGLDTAFTFDQHFRQYGWHIWGDGQ